MKQNSNDQMKYWYYYFEYNNEIGSNSPLAIPIGLEICLLLLEYRISDRRYPSSVFIGDKIFKIFISVADNFPLTLE